MNDPISKSMAELMLKDPFAGATPMAAGTSGSAVQITVTYYRKMVAGKVYSFEVEVKTPPAAASNEPMVLRPVVAGAHVTPLEAAVTPGRTIERLQFGVTPLGTGKLAGSRLEVYRGPAMVQSVELRTRAVPRATPARLLALAVLLPLLFLYVTQSLPLATANGTPGPIATALATPVPPLPGLSAGAAAKLQAAYDALAARTVAVPVAAYMFLLLVLGAVLNALTAVSSKGVLRGSLVGVAPVSPMPAVPGMVGMGGMPSAATPRPMSRPHQLPPFLTPVSPDEMSSGR